MNLGGPEALIIGVLILLVFGAGWLPKLARNMGRTKVEIDKAKEEFEKTKSDLAGAAGPLNDAAAAVKKVDQTLKKPAKEVVNKALDL